MRAVREEALLPEPPAPRERPDLLGHRLERRGVVARAGRVNGGEQGGMRDVRAVAVLPEPPVPREPPDSRMGRRGVLVRAAPNRGERGMMIVRAVAVDLVGFESKSCAQQGEHHSEGRAPPQYLGRPRGGPRSSTATRWCPRSQAKITTRYARGARANRRKFRGEEYSRALHCSAVLYSIRIQ